MPPLPGKTCIVFVENDDSFSWNVIDSLPFDRDAVAVIQGGDAVPTGAVAIVIGPGPLDPLRSPHLVDTVRWAASHRIPLLGVCLGHQAIGVAFGGRLVRTEPVHGKRSSVRFAPSRLFPGIEGEVEVMRYHSLVVQELGDPLRVVAATVKGLCMAIEHATLPIAGVQFHPDSFGTPRGREILHAFFRAVL